MICFEAVGRVDVDYVIAKDGLDSFYEDLVDVLFSSKVLFVFKGSGEDCIVL